MKTGFNIVFVTKIDPEVTKVTFKAAIRNFNIEYAPASFVSITEVKHLGTSYCPDAEDFQHSFSVNWEEPAEKR